MVDRMAIKMILSIEAAIMKYIKDSTQLKEIEKTASFLKVVISNRSWLKEGYNCSIKLSKFNKCAQRILSFMPQLFFDIIRQSSIMFDMFRQQSTTFDKIIVYEGLLGCSMIIQRNLFLQYVIAINFWHDFSEQQLTLNRLASKIG